MISSKLTLPVQRPQKLLTDSSAQLSDQWPTLIFFALYAIVLFCSPIDKELCFPLLVSLRASTDLHFYMLQMPRCIVIVSPLFFLFFFKQQFYGTLHNFIVPFPQISIILSTIYIASVLQMNCPVIRNTDTGFPIYLVYLYNMSQLNLQRANLHSWDSLLWAFQFPYRVLIPDYDCFL